MNKYMYAYMYVCMYVCVYTEETILLKYLKI